MDGLNVDGADKCFAFLKGHYDKKRKLFEGLGFPLSGAITYRDWEVFVAVLTRDRCKPGNGCDLERHEVKSAMVGGGFEYQYHRKTWEEKLDGDLLVDHVFVSYGVHYNFVEVHRVLTADIRSRLEEWRDYVKDCYDVDNPKQRCRRSMSYSFVKGCGELIWASVSG